MNGGCFLWEFHWIGKYTAQTRPMDFRPAIGAMGLVLRFAAGLVR